MSNDWSTKSKRWKEAHLSGLKALYGGQELLVAQRSLVPPKTSTRKPKKGVESERKAQQRLVQWLHQESIPFYAIPNGANVSIHHRATLLSEGMQPGAPDLCIPRARGHYHGLYIELKRADGGSGLSEVQKHWLKILQEEGYHAVRCDGFDKAKEKVEWYLSLSASFAISKGTNTTSTNTSSTSKSENVENVDTLLLNSLTQE